MHWPTPLLSLRGRIALRVSSAPYLTKWLVLGVLIGAVAGVGAIAFVTLLELSTHFLLGVVGGYTAPSPANEGGITAAGHFARPWAIPLVVGLGGLISGLLVYRFAPEASGHGTDAAIAAVHNDPKGIRPKTALVKMVASAITIGSGGSGGREGPTAQISAGFASFLARGFGLSQDDARIAVTIGMGAGIGAIFRTPLGGAVVGAEVLYRRDFETAAIVPGLIASIVGFVVFGAVEGFAPIFGYHEALRFDQPIQLVYYALIGVAAALVGLLYDKAFWTTHDLFGRSRWPRWLLPAVGGLLVGCIALLFPQVLGTGYGWVQQMMTRPGLMSLSLWLVLLLPLAKILATSLSIGSGGSGGIFGPGMVIGALVGAGVWRVLEAIAPGVPLSPAPFVIVGMMASFGSIGHIPIATMLMVAEMTGNLSLLAPAMVAVGIATLIVGDRHIYHSQLASREDAPAHRFRFGLTPVGALPLATVMQDPPLVLQADEPALDALERVDAAGLESAPVVGRDGAYLGILPASAESTGRGRTETAGDLAAARGPVIPADSTLDTAIELLALNRATWAPVVSADGRLAGTATSKRLLRHYTRLVHAGVRRLDALAGRGALFEGRLAADAEIAGMSIGEVVWPPDTLVLSVRRGEETLFATPEMRVRRDDELVVVTRPEHMEALDGLLGSRPEPDARRGEPLL